MTVSMNDAFQTARTTFWTRHDASVPSDDDGPMKTSGDEVTEAVVSSSHLGRHLEMSMLVTSTVVPPGSDGASDGGYGKRHPSGSGINPESL